MKNIIFGGYEIQDAFYSIDLYWVEAPASDLVTLQEIQSRLKNALSKMDIECDEWEFNISDIGIDLLTDAIEFMFEHFKMEIANEPDEDEQCSLESRLEAYKHLCKKLYQDTKVDWLGSEFSKN